MSKRWIYLFCFAYMIFAIGLTNAKSTNASANVSGPMIQVKVDGKQIVFSDGQPYIDPLSGRTFVPVRFIAQALGAQVGWDGGRQLVTITLGEKKIHLIVGQNQAMVNGKRITFDAKTVLIQNRTYVPLRFISEMLGSKVNWIPSTQTVVIQKNVSSFKDNSGIYGIHIGQSSSEVLALLGAPQRKDSSTFGYEWWIYNTNASKYVQVGIQGGRVVDLYSPSSTWEFKGIKKGSAYATLKQSFSFEPTVSFSYDGASFTLTNSLDDRALIMINDIPTLFYIDQHDSKKVVGIRFMNKEWLVKTKSYSIQWKYFGDPPQVDPPILSKEQQSNAQKANEKQIFDLVNVVRTQYELPILQWNEKAASVARGHSLDMKEHQFFDHISATTGLDPFQRMKKEGITFRTAGENIAMGYMDAIETHHGWMNSLGHRKNIINPSFTTLGVGVKGTYSTQNFITP